MARRWILVLVLVLVRLGELCSARWGQEGPGIAVRAAALLPAGGPWLFKGISSRDIRCSYEPHAACQSAEVLLGGGVVGGDVFLGPLPPQTLRSFYCGGAAVASPVNMVV